MICIVFSYPSVKPCFFGKKMLFWKEPICVWLRIFLREDRKNHYSLLLIFLIRRFLRFRYARRFCRFGFRLKWSHRYIKILNGNSWQLFFWWNGGWIVGYPFCGKTVAEMCSNGMTTTTTIGIHSKKRDIFKNRRDEPRKIRTCGHFSLDAFDFCVEVGLFDFLG